MNLKHTLPLLTLLLLSFVGNAQKLQNDINLRLTHDKTNIRSVDLFAGNIVIQLSQTGKVRLNALPNTQYAYVDPFDTRSGKFSIIDNQPVTYYDDFEQSRAGKIKSVGSLAIAYYDQYDGFDNIGLAKNIGGTAITYYDKYDGLDNIGKIKSIGNVKIIYNDRYDGLDNTGKIKSIGNISIKYYDRYDGPNKTGKIKSITGRTPYVTIDGLTDEDMANADTGF